MGEGGGQKELYLGSDPQNKHYGAYKACPTRLLAQKTSVNHIATVGS